jgi:hypothetical protein
MSILSWFSDRFASTRSPEEPGWLRRLVVLSPGRDDPKVDKLKEAAAADVAEIEEEGREHFRPDAPGHREDDL